MLIPHPIDLTLTQPVFASEIAQYCRDSSRALQARKTFRSRRITAELNSVLDKYPIRIISIQTALALTALPATFV
jgi:hypothetical protein